jgi:hypothetical protein
MRTSLAVYSVGTCSKLVRYTTRRLKFLAISLKGEYQNGKPKQLITANRQTLTFPPLTIIFPSIQMQKVRCQITIRVSMIQMPAADQN